MAGSWNHIVDGAGRFNGSWLVHENGGDTVEALEECYGMVWFLAARVYALTHNVGNGVVTREQLETIRDPILEIVEEARRNYQMGLGFSPGFTTKAARQRINYDKAWGEHTAQPVTDKEHGT
jgi:hypothetical protein